MTAFLTRSRFLSLFVAALLAAAAATPVAAQDKSPAAPMPKAEREKIESVVKAYILKNPEVIIEAIQGLREREERKTQEMAKANLGTVTDALVKDPNTPIGGNPKGDVNVIEFFDYRCGYCKRVFPDILKLVEGDKNVRFVYVEFPILGPDSLTASKAGLAAWLLDKSKYEVFHSAMMTGKGGLPEERVMKFAEQSGYDVKALKKAMSDPRIESMIEKNMGLAKALDINGTPGFIIGDQIIRGAVDLKSMQALVAKARGG
ncbi:MAG: DsbA family protein [Alphaproteobacteria bacterium]|nr:DsbA family protein [Alphaproteobacteria bacterium]